MARIASAIFGPGDSNFTEKRRSLCALTCVPRPSVKRPPEAFCRSQAMCAVIIGLRENTVAMLVPSLMRDVDGGGDAERQIGIVLGLGRPEAVVAHGLDLPRVVGERS